jgi:TfoX/Sxy family transcriptional regulator of competence genes
MRRVPVGPPDEAARERRAARHLRQSWAMILGMAYDEDLANRIRELIAGEPDVSEQGMFGGLVFLVGGKMSVAAGGQGSLIVRVDPEDTDELLAGPHAQPFVMGGRPMQGRVRVDAEGVRTKRQLERWVRRSVAYARSLRSKQ